MGTPDFAVPSLHALLETQEVVGVVTQPDKPAGRGKQLRPSPVKLAAEAAGIPIYQPPSLRSETAVAPLREWQPDVIVVAAFGQILRPHLLNLPPHGCLNVHASLLPRWRGASPIHHAILHGDAESGVCLMQMDVGLDTGPVYACQATSITADDTAVTLHDRLAEIGAHLLRTHLNSILSGHLLPTPQDESQVTYAPMIDKNAGELQWQETAVALHRRIRAMTPWPGAYTTWQGTQLKILQARPYAHPLPPAQPGQVIQHNGQIIVCCADGGLQLEELQLAGKRPLSIAEFLRGQPNLANAILGQ